MSSIRKKDQANINKETIYTIGITLHCRLFFNLKELCHNSSYVVLYSHPACYVGGLGQFPAFHEKEEEKEKEEKTSLPSFSRLRRKRKKKKRKPKPPLRAIAGITFFSPAEQSWAELSQSTRLAFSTWPVFLNGRPLAVSRWTHMEEVSWLAWLF